MDGVSATNRSLAANRRVCTHADWTSRSAAQAGPAGPATRQDVSWARILQVACTADMIWQPEEAVSQLEVTSSAWGVPVASCHRLCVPSQLLWQSHRAGPYATDELRHC